MTNTAPSRREMAWAEGVGIFAGVALMTLGLFQFFQGLSAAAEDDVFLTTRNYVFEFDLTAWGWIHMILGAIAVVVGACIMASQSWSYIAGIAIAVLSAISSFAFLPYYPLWGLVIVAFDIAVIWALATMLANPPRH